MKRLRALRVILSFLVAAMAAVSGVVASAAEEARPRIALVLSGGGARGMAHIGVLQMLEKHQVPIDFIAGTSMGAVLGGLYAAGYSPDELETIVTELDWADVFEDSPPRANLSFRRKQDDLNFLAPVRLGLKKDGIAFPRGVVQGQKLNLVLRKLLLHVAQVRHFDELRIPFVAVSTDIVTGDAVIHDRGDLPIALRASMSIPGVFEPVESDGRLLVDGFVSNNIPIDLALARGADVVIAVNVGNPPLGSEDLTSSLAIVGQAMAILTDRLDRQQIAQLRPQDLLLVPELEGIGSSDFEISASIVPKGREVAETQTSRLRELGTGTEGWENYLALQRRTESNPPLITSVVLENDSRLDNALLASRLESKEGEDLDLDALDRDIAEIYGLDAFSQINYRIEDTPEGSVLRIDAAEKSWGPQYLRVGLRLEENFDNTSLYELALSHTVHPWNSLGGEWRNELQLGDDIRIFTELWQPFDLDTRWFFAPSLEFLRETLPIYEGDEKRGEFSVRSTTAGLDLGRQLGDWGEFRFGLRWSDRRNRPLSGPSSFSSSETPLGGFFLRLGIDTLDSTSFPRSGVFGNFTLAAVRDSFGADSDYEIATSDFLSFRSFGENTIGFGGSFNTLFSGPREVSDLFRLGGFFELSGLDRQQLSGRHSGFFRVFGYRRVANPGVLSFTFPLYLGASLETGNTWDDRSDIRLGSFLWSGSVFLGFETPLGPLYIAYGVAEGGQHSPYLFLGRSF